MSGEREGGRRNGVLPPLTRTHASPSNSSRARTDRTSLHPSLRENKADFLNDWNPPSSTKVCTLLNAVQARHAAEVRGRQERARERRDSGRALQHLGQRPWLQWWRRGLSSVSPNPRFKTCLQPFSDYKRIIITTSSTDTFILFVVKADLFNLCIFCLVRIMLVFLYHNRLWLNNQSEWQMFDFKPPFCI